MPEFDDDGGDTPSGDEASASITMSGVSQNIFAVLAVLLGTFAAPQRLKVLRPICERWRVSVPRAAAATREEDACRVAMGRLAAKMSYVMEKSANKPSLEGGRRKTSLPLMPFFYGDDELHVLNAAVGGDESLGGHRPHNISATAPSPATEEVHSWIEEPVITIQVRRRV
ncbi:receptor-type adenylate cyclase [Trypanosoma conorhini]|uniref:Receptor-type adenylate cyclase n=1 Tax=Trypanosoma conorhini TaxID=83891 RepID=A0A422NGW7_9TRYP|nr:receptor-type adenylate cyclase [Trypanosoma conorhini]RNF04723.1 receptor-type adenylate cyclase [Trypanosoma conorhini]